MSSIRRGGIYQGRRPGPPPVDTRRHHLDWLGLVEVTGPFLTLPVLTRIWSPQLDALEPEARRSLRAAHDQWQDQGAAGQHAWVAYVLRELLEWNDALLLDDGSTADDDTEAMLAKLALDVPQHDAQIVPSFALTTPGAADITPALLGLILPSASHPAQRLKGSTWSATPVDRLATLCRHHGVELGLVTDGRWWALVWAPRGGVTTTAIFDAVTWPEQGDRDVVRAFRSLLRRSRFFSVPADEQLSVLLTESLKSGAEVTEELGRQVRQAVEMLVDAIGRANTQIDAQDAYRGAVAVMMRIVFLLYAEERGLLPVDNAVYATAYFAGGLYRELKDQADQTSEAELAHTSAAWHRLIALFHAVYGGIDHPRLYLRAYDGSLFDPKTYWWLDSLGIDDRTVLHMLGAVQYVELGAGKHKELRQLSFRALDVEQIGYVYEGLLSFEGLRATETVLGLIGKGGQEEEVSLSELEDLARQFHAGERPDTDGLATKLAETYKSSGIGSASAIAKRLALGSEAMQQNAMRRLLAVTSGDRGLVERLLPFAGIIRDDLRGDPVVILAGAIYVTESRQRKNTGTHYTPRFLAEEVAEGALEPLVYFPGPLQTADRSEWKLRCSEEILGLKVADIAMGSAAFLVAACRYLADRLVETGFVDDEGQAAPGAIQQDASDAAVDAEADHVVVRARRRVIENCLYGVDINPMAIEMAKLSLWLVSMDKERPFTFLDDRFIAGDSLLGVDSLEQLENVHIDPKAGRKLHADTIFSWTERARTEVRDAAEDRRQITQISGENLAGLEEKRRLLSETKEHSSWLDLIGDLTTGAALAKHHPFLEAAQLIDAAVGGDIRDANPAVHAAREKAIAWLATDQPQDGFVRDPVHWPIVFPEVFGDGRHGFDAIVGNPPFLGGQKLTGVLGEAYREYLVLALGRGKRGSADLVAYFELRAHQLLNRGGQTGLIATNTLAQGDTREVGLDQISSDKVTIRQAVKSAPWPSTSAALEYCAVWTSVPELPPEAPRILDGLRVRGITSSLDAESRVTGKPYRLVANQGPGRGSFIGSYVLGKGFILEPDQARELIDRDPRNKDVLFPYLNGEDLNSRPDCSASRWVINFHDWSEERARGYPEVFDIVERLVKPVRLANNRKVYRDYWWQYGEKRPAMQKAIAGLDRVLVVARVSKTCLPVFAATSQVISEASVVFASDDVATLAVLSSGIHYAWAIARGSSLKGDLRYTPSDVYETLPLPELADGSDLTVLGSTLDEARAQIMLGRGLGLTRLYNAVHDNSVADVDILRLRDIHEQIDLAVASAYGWSGLDLHHGFHETRQGLRHTLNPVTQVEVLDRLLALNHERHAQEQRDSTTDSKRRASDRAGRKLDNGHPEHAEGVLF